jgi:hypothetical protein
MQGEAERALRCRPPSLPNRLSFRCRFDQLGDLQALSGLQAEKNDVAGKDRQKNIERSSELTNWFFEQASTGCKVMFAKYLNFTDPK